MKLDGGEIRRDDGEARGRSVLDMPDGRKSELTYVKSGADHLLVDYKFVPPPFRGRGVAERLVRHTVEEARKDRK